GHFTWKEWSAALAHELQSAADRGEPDDGSRYYEHWLAALERLAQAKGLTMEKHSPRAKKPGRKHTGAHRTGNRSSSAMSSRVLRYSPPRRGGVARQLNRSWRAGVVSSAERSGPADHPVCAFA